MHIFTLPLELASQNLFPRHHKISPNILFPTCPIWHCCRMLLMFTVITDTAGKTFGELFDKADHYSDHSPDSDPSQTNYFCHKNTFQCISPLKGPNILEKNTTPEIEDKTSLKTDMLDVHSSVFRCTLCVHLCLG